MLPNVAGVALEAVATLLASLVREKKEVDAFKAEGGADVVLTRLRELMVEDPDSVKQLRIKTNVVKVFSLTFHAPPHPPSPRSALLFGTSSEADGEGGRVLPRGGQSERGAGQGDGGRRPRQV